MENDDIELLCATISRYQDTPLSLLSGIVSDENSKKCLLFMEAQTSSFDGKEKYTIISDSQNERDAQFLFNQKDFQSALEAYNELNSQGMIDIPNELARYKINENIQITGIADSGKFRYEIDGLTNGNIAILATCLYFKQMINNDHAISMAEDMAKLYNIYTV